MVVERRSRNGCSAHTMLYLDDGTISVVLVVMCNSKLLSIRRGNRICLILQLSDAP